VKDVISLSNSNQFRGYFATGKPVELIVSTRNVTISEPLEKEILKNGGSIQIFDPITKTFTPWVRK